jgi:flagellar basal body rod protein FlgB
MIKSLFGAGTGPYVLRGALEEQMATQRVIAQRITQATQASSGQSFGDQLSAKLAGQQPAVDLNQEMAALADTNLRYEATAKMLQGAYNKLRTAFRDRA